MLHVACNINDIAADRACSRQTACTKAQEHSLANSVAIDKHSVINAVNSCQRMSQRNHRRSNSQRNTIFRVIFSNTQQLNSVAKTGCVFNIAGFNIFNALHLYVVQTEASIESNRSQDNNLTRCVQAADVCRRIGFSIALLLCVLQYLIIVQMLICHL